MTLLGHKSMHYRIIVYVMAILVSYYFHEWLRYVHYDVLHMHIPVPYTSMVITSIFPFQEYPESVHLDAQMYLWKLSRKVIFYMCVQLLHDVLKLLNTLDNPIPGYFDDSVRLIKGLRWFTIIQIGFFMFFASQQDWLWDILLILVCFLTPFMKWELPKRISDVQKPLQ